MTDDVLVPRDIRKDAGYWVDFITNRQNALAGLQTQLARGGTPRQKLIWKVSTAANSQRLAMAAYSAGSPLDEVAQQTEIALTLGREYVRATASDEPFDLRSRDNYCSALWLLSLGYCLELSPSVLDSFVGELERRNRGKDQLFERLLAACSLGETSSATKILHPRPYKLLLDAVEAEEADRPRLIADYLKHYYAQSRGAYWWGMHLLEASHSTYTGYWCFEVAAFVRALGIDDTLFLNDQFYPRDLAIGRAPARRSAPYPTRIVSQPTPSQLVVAPDSALPSVDSLEAVSNEDALRLLARLLLPADASLVTEIELALKDPRAFCEQFADRLDVRGINPAEPIDVWVLGMCDGLAERGRVGIVDWRATIEDIIAAVDVETSPLTRNPLRWAWVEDFQDSTIDAPGRLQLVADHLAEEGWTLANLDTDSDEYTLIVIPTSTAQNLSALSHRAASGRNGGLLLPPYVPA